MPSPEHTDSRRVRRKINPATAPVEELLSHLATDPAAGLSQKEAERRLDAHIAMLAKSSSRNAHAQAELNFAEVANA
jgi:hypothetical protein